VKRVLIILFMGFMLLAFVGCSSREVSSIPREPEIMKLADDNESNFVIRLDYDKKIDYDLKIFVDGKLCKDGKISGKFGHEVMRYPLNLDETSHDVTVAINNKMHSSIRFKVSNELKWLLISYSSSQVLFVPGSGTILID
jgi:hypothetical protein